MQLGLSIMYAVSFENSGVNAIGSNSHLHAQLDEQGKAECNASRTKIPSKCMLQASGSFNNRLTGDASLATAVNDNQADVPLQSSQRQRAKPRGLSSCVQKTVSRITKSAGAVIADPSFVSSDTSNASGAQGQTAEEDEQSSSGSAAAGYESESGLTTQSEALDTALVEALPQGRSLGSPTRSFRGQGKPPLSPVRQSLQDLTLSRDSSPAKLALVPVSIDPVTGMPKQDVNVHCNPLFTEPMAGQHTVHSSASPKQNGDKADSDQKQQQQRLADNHPRAVPSSPPSQLQKSLRAMLQQHAAEMEVGMHT